MKKVLFVLLGILLISLITGRSQGYQQRDLDIACYQDYVDGFQAGLEKSSETTSPETKSKLKLPSNVIENCEIYNLSYQITEKNDIWWKLPWKLVIKNNTSYIVNFYVNFNF